MASTVALPHANINGKIFAAIPNSNLKNKDGSDKSTLDHVVDFTKSANGAFRLFQFLERVTKAVVLVLKELGNKLAGFFEALAGKFLLAWTAMTLPRLPELTQAAKKAIVDWSKPPEGPATNATRSKIEKIHVIADATAAYGYAASWILSNPALQKAADAANLVNDATDMSMAAEDWSLARDHLKHIDKKNAAMAPVYQRFQDTMKHAFIKLVKAVCSVVTGVLGLMVLAFGGPILPAAILVAISLTSTVAAMAAHFFKETSAYELVDFHKVRNPQILVAGSPAS